MRINWSGLIQDASGSFGNTVASSWKGLHYFREKASVVSNPKTTAQMDIRNRMVGLIASYKTLTLVQLAQWGEYAQAQGSANEDESQEGSQWLIPKRSRTQSGINAYIGVNQRLTSIGLAEVEEPPLTPSDAGLTGFLVTWTTPKMVITCTADADLITAKPGLKARLWCKGWWKGAHAYIVASKVITVPAVSIDVLGVRMGSSGLIWDVPLVDLIGRRVFYQADIVAPDGSISPATGVIPGIIT